jgi:hypothetical protein
VPFLDNFIQYNMPVLKSKPTKTDFPLGLPVTEKIVYEYSIVRSLTKTIIYTESLIDEKYNELELNKGACVQMTLIRDNWYILSSDGIKID